MAKLPEGWIVADLGEFCEGIRGVTYKPDDLVQVKTEKTITLLRSNNIQAGALNFKDVQHVAQKNVNQKQVAQLGDIAVCMSNGSKRLVGKSAAFKHIPEGRRYTVGSFCSIFRPLESACPVFVEQVFCSDEFQRQVDFSLAGSAINNLKNSDLIAYQFLKPPLPEQQKIATILTSVDTVIEKTRAQIDKLKHLKTGMMQQLLTQGIGHTEFKNTPVGRIPKAWEIQNINGLVTKVGSGVTPRGGSAAYVSSGVPLIRSQNVYSDGLRLEDVAYITAEQHKKMGNSQLKPNDVLLNITGASIGRCHYLPSDFKEGNVNQHVCIIRPKQSVINSAFLAYLLNSELGQRQIMSLQAGGNREGINFQQIREISFAIPTLPEQQKIVNVLQSIDTKIIAANQKFNSVEQTKKALMQDLLTGNVRI